MNSVKLFLSILLVVTLAADVHCDDRVMLKVLGTYKTGVFGKSELEIGAYHSPSRRVFVVAGEAPHIRIIDISNPAMPKLKGNIDISGLGAAANSVAVFGNIVVAAVEARVKTERGVAAFFDVDGKFINAVKIGSLPDMICFSPDGRYVLAANEGEPSDDYTEDPEGTMSIIDLAKGVENLSDKDVVTLDFKEFNDRPLPEFVRIATPGIKTAKDFEPEYIAVSPDSSKAWVTLQENNAIAEVDIPSKQITRVFGLPFIDHSIEANVLDVSDKDKTFSPGSWPVRGIPQPDAIAVFEIAGKKYLITANEGDSRDYQAFSEEARVAELKLDEKGFPAAEELQKKNNLGRLKVTTTMGDTNGDGIYEALYSFGSRSFSIFAEDGSRIYDSGGFFERYLAIRIRENASAGNGEKEMLDSRSDDKGPEPEGVVIGSFDGRTLAFIGCERAGGVFTFDLSNPEKPEFQSYTTNCSFEINNGTSDTGDIGPEGMIYIAPQNSPNGKALLVVFYEVSGSMTIYELIK